MIGGPRGVEVSCRIECFLLSRTPSKRGWFWFEHLVRYGAGCCGLSIASTSSREWLLTKSRVSSMHDGISLLIDTALHVFLVDIQSLCFFPSRRCSSTIRAVKFGVYYQCQKSWGFQSGASQSIAVHQEYVPTHIQFIHNHGVYHPGGLNSASIVNLLLYVTIIISRAVVWHTYEATKNINTQKERSEFQPLVHLNYIIIERMMCESPAASILTTTRKQRSLPNVCKPVLFSINMRPYHKDTNRSN